MTWILGVVLALGFYGLLITYTRPQGNLGSQSIRGWFRVCYPDGEWSQRFQFRTARCYAGIYKGRVKWHTQIPKHKRPWHFIT